MRGPDEAAVTGRLADVLELCSQGLTDKEIATRLGIAVATVDTHWKRIRERYGDLPRAGIIAKWIREQVETDPESAQKRLEALATQLQTLYRKVDELQSQGPALELVEFCALGTEAIVYASDFHSFKMLYVSPSVKHWGWEPADWMSGKVNVATEMVPEDLAMVEEARRKAAELGKRSAAMLYRVRTPAKGIVWFLDRPTITAAHMRLPGLSIGVGIEATPWIEAGVLKAEPGYWFIDEPPL